MGSARARTAVGRPRRRLPFVPWTGRWSSDAQSLSELRGPGRGWGQCVRPADPCTTVARDETSRRRLRGRAVAAAPPGGPGAARSAPGSRPGPARRTGAPPSPGRRRGTRPPRPARTTANLPPGARPGPPHLVHRDLQVQAAAERPLQGARHPAPPAGHGRLLEHDLRPGVGEPVLRPLVGHPEAARAAPEAQAGRQVGDHELGHHGRPGEVSGEGHDAVGALVSATPIMPGRSPLVTHRPSGRSMAASAEVSLGPHPVPPPPGRPEPRSSAARPGPPRGPALCERARR